jgi:hypothetical protein
MYHHHHMAQNGAHSLATGLESPQSALSLVTEPLLDLRNFRNDKHKKKIFSYKGLISQILMKLCL